MTDSFIGARQKWEGHPPRVDKSRLPLFIKLCTRLFLLLITFIYFRPWYSVIIFSAGTFYCPAVSELRSSRDTMDRISIFSPLIDRLLIIEYRVDSTRTLHAGDGVHDLEMWCSAPHLDATSISTHSLVSRSVTYKYSYPLVKLRQIMPRLIFMTSEVISSTRTSHCLVWWCFSFATP